MAPRKALGARPSYWLWFGLIVSSALVFRVINALFVLHDGNPHFDPAAVQGTDMWGNHTQALEILESGGFPDIFYHHAPLYPHIIAIVYGVFPGAFQVVYGIQILAGALLAGLVYWMGRRAWDEATGRVAGFIQALYAPLLFNETTFMADALAPAFLMVYLALLMVFEKLPALPVAGDDVGEFRKRPPGVFADLKSFFMLRPGGRAPLLVVLALGLTLGLATAQRGNFGLLGLGLIPWMFFVPRQFGFAVRFAAVGMVGVISLGLLIPFAYHNTLEERAQGSLGPDEYAFTQGEYYKVVRMGGSVNSPGYFFYPEGYANKEYPKYPMHKFGSPGYWKLLGRKARFYLSWYEFPDLNNFYIDGRFSPLIRWNPLKFGLVGPFALLGLALGMARWRELTVMYHGLAIVSLGIVMYYIASRFRACSMPLMILFAAWGAVWLARRAAERRWAGLFPALVALAGFFWFCNSLDPGRFHSMWYSDSAMSQAFMLRTRKELAKGPLADLNRAERSARRMLWVRDPYSQQLGHYFIAEIARVRGDEAEQLRNIAIVRRLQAIRDAQPELDWHGNKFTPPTAGFRSVDPIAAARIPEDALGIEPEILAEALERQRPFF